LSFEEIKKVVRKLKTSSGRLDVQTYKNFILIDDTYNANPDSTKAAIELVGRIKTHKRKILFLGDMLELGINSIKLHQRLKDVIYNSGINEVYTIGSKMKYLNENLFSKKIVAKHSSSRSSLLNHIKKMNFNDSVILVKGSRGLHMEEFVSEIKNKNMN
jgi:UDP-N-acetylmuramoyl-tripeptide--D-alanyl-D-alanine ligase